MCPTPDEGPNGHVNGHTNGSHTNGVNGTNGGKILEGNDMGGQLTDVASQTTRDSRAYKLDRIQEIHISRSETSSAMLVDSR